MSVNLGLGMAGLGLLALASQPEARGLYYKNKIVTLDGYSFKECRFDGCTLVANSANFKLDHCVIDEASFVQFGPQVQKIVQLFTSRYSWLATMVPGLAPVLNPDGTISIGA